jgi:fused signal recognition particle receptor
MPGWLSSFKNGLKKTRQAMGLGGLFRGGTLDEDFLEDLEDRLIMADLGPSLSNKIIEEMNDAAESGELDNTDKAFVWLKERMIRTLTPTQKTTKDPGVGQDTALWFFLGVNGVGKTTSLGKLGLRLKENGFSVLYGAGDTFRAAAAEQLELWANRSGAQIVRHRAGGDPSAVVFDAVEAAKSRQADYLLMDTAGRLHNKKNLMAECSKMFRTAERQGGNIEEVFLVVDATTGQNAVQQAKLFSEVAPLSGIILTKMDGSAKGGVALQLVESTGIPIRYVGLGESEKDLMDFSPEDFVEAMLSTEGDES